MPEQQQGAHILVVDDDARLRALIQRFLTQHGYVVSVADSAEDAQAKLQSIRYDLCVLDVSPDQLLARLDGNAVASTIIDGKVIYRRSA